MRSFEQQLKSHLKAQKKGGKRKKKTDKELSQKKSRDNEEEEATNKKRSHQKNVKLGEKEAKKGKQTKKKFYTPKSHKNLPTKVRNTGKIDEFRIRTESYTQESQRKTTGTENTWSPRISFQKNARKSTILRRQINSLKFDKNYKGIYQVLISELADFPKNILNTEHVPENQTKNSGSNAPEKDATLGSKQFLNCSFHCGPDDSISTFDSGEESPLTQESKWREQLNVGEMTRNFCCFHVENFCISYQNLLDLFKLYFGYFSANKTKTLKALSKIFGQITNSSQTNKRSRELGNQGKQRDHLF